MTAANPHWFYVKEKMPPYGQWVCEAKVAEIHCFRAIPKSAFGIIRRKAGETK